MADPIKTLASRFVSLPLYLRTQVAKRLLMRREEDQNAETAESQSKGLNERRKKSFLEQFWDEVENTHGDGRYPRNPFIERKPGLRFGG